MPESPSPILVIGAGVVGLSTALFLARSGRAVTVVDPLPPPGGASYGNAGMISADTAVPIALPGMLRKVPSWLADPLGPLAVRPSYFPKALPWLLRWVEAGRISRVLAISDALRAMHRNAFDVWKELLGASRFYDLMRPVGQVHLWEEDAESETGRVEQQIRDRHGIETQRLSADELRQMFPGIAPAVRRGLLVPGNGYTVSPQRLVRTLGELLLEAGGEIVAERALKIIPGEGGTHTVMTNIGWRRASAVVVAAGAWSGRLLEPLGISVPLETERGYHAMLPNPGIAVTTTITNKSRSFGVTPMEDGLRVDGTVEIAGLDAPPDERRAAVLLDHVRRMFPDVDTREHRFWMGFRPSTPDSLPIVGPAPGRPGLYLAFGHGHFGMTGGPRTGQIVAQLILGQTPMIDPRPYAATRFSGQGRNAADVTAEAAAERPRAPA